MIYEPPILHLFHLIIQASPAFRFASIITQRDAALPPHIQPFQSVLVRIWRAHIKRYLEGESSTSPPDNPPRQINSTIDEMHNSSQQQGLEENGHHIISLQSGGVVCQKCGKYTSEPKHRRLKISKNPCKQSHLKPEFWTTIPSQKNNPNSHLDNFAAILKVESEHHLAWKFFCFQHTTQRNSQVSKMFHCFPVE